MDFLQPEREKSNITTGQISELIYEGKDNVMKIQKFQRMIENEKVFDNSEEIFMARSKRFHRGLKKAFRFEEIKHQLNLGGSDAAFLYDCIGESMPTLLHELMFIPTVRALYTDEQWNEWEAKMRSLEIIGCYAQTEMGHGSNIKALETTAMFIPETDEFQIDTPTLTAMKWWPGTLGRVSNYAMVIARLLIGTKDYGIHNFMVPIRDPVTHLTLPGVQVGDIGPKMGFTAIDNGFLILQRVRIPRRYMAMRYTKVDRNGNYSKETGPHEKVASLAMMEVRAVIVSSAGRNLAKGCTIAIRYSAVRKQGYDESGVVEMPVLDYTIQQYRLLPLLATSYAFFFAGIFVKESFKSVLQRALNGKDDISAAFSQLHATLSGLKSFCSRTTADGIEECRKACGGHGYLLASGFPELHGTYLQSCTVEGDNYLLTQQVVKFLLKVLQQVRKGNTPHGESEYFWHWGPLLNCSCQAKSQEEMGEPQSILKALQHRAVRLVLRVESSLKMHIGRGLSAGAAWNQCLVDVARASRAHSVSVIFKFFTQMIELKKNSLAPENIDILLKLQELFGLYSIENDMGDFTEDGYLSFAQADFVRAQVLSLLQSIRPHAVLLVDAFIFSDFELKSVLGKRDGNVYESLFESVVRNPLNQPAEVKYINESISSFKNIRKISKL